MASDLRFASYPSTFCFSEPKGGRRVDQLLWGQRVRLLGDRDGEFELCRVKGRDCWISAKELQDKRVLEITFVDFGSGDGALVVAPDSRKILVDAGAGDGMYRYLRWCFVRSDRTVEFDAAVISHPDIDHYLGFEPIFKDSRFHTGTLYINGIVARAGKNSLGPRTKEGDQSFLEDLVSDRAQFESLIRRAPAGTTRRLYPKLLRTALDSGNVADLKMLSTREVHIPGFEAGAEISIEVLGPIVEESAGEAPRLPWLGTVGETKKGHSIVLRLSYGNVRVLLGGDPGPRGENLLLAHHTGLDTDTQNPREVQQLVACARARLESDVAKLCDHGDSGLTEAYLRSVNAVATVASLGNEESGSKRPEILGLLGRHGRGSQPLIFSSTDIAQGAMRTRYELARLLHEELASSSTNSNSRIQRLADAINRWTAVYGSVHLATDGQKIVIAQRLDRSLKSGWRWSIYPIEPDDRGRLRFSRPVPVRKRRKDRENPLWRPDTTAEGTAKPTAVHKTDLYAVIDEIVGVDALVGFADWPRVDSRGRLVFQQDERRVPVSREILDDLIKQFRLRDNQVIRPLRTGDVFRIRFSREFSTRWKEAGVGELFSVKTWRQLQDVTAAAREAAKKAQSAAISPALDAPTAEKLGLSPEPSLRADEDLSKGARTPGSVAQSVV